ADGLDVGLDGQHHIEDERRVERVRGAGDVVDAGEVGGFGVRDGGVDDRRAGGLAGGGHALGGQRRDGDNGVIPVRDDLGADLVEGGGVVLAVEVLVLDAHAEFGGFGVELRLDGSADLVEAGVVHLLDDGDLVAGGGRLSGSGVGRRVGRDVDVYGSAAGRKAGEHGDGGQQGDELFHKVSPLQA